MNYRISTILILLCTCYYGCSDRFLGLVPDIEGLEDTFIKNYGGSYDQTGVEIVQLDDGFLLVGNTYSETNGFESQMYLVETDLKGVIRETKVVAVGDDVVEGRVAYISPTADGGFLLCGTSTRIQNATDDWDETDIWLVKLNSAYDVLWNKHLGSLEDNEFGAAVQEVNGAIFVLGTTTQVDPSKDKSATPIDYPDVDITLFKLEPNQGELVWQKNYGYTGIDEGKDLLDLGNGQLLILGVTDYPEDGSLDQEVLLITVNEEGNESNTRTYGTRGVEEIPSRMSFSGDGQQIGITGLIIESGLEYPLFLRVDLQLNPELAPMKISFIEPDEPTLEPARGFDIEPGILDENTFIISGTGFFDIMLLQIDDQGIVGDRKFIGTDETDEVGGGFVLSETGATVIGTIGFIDNSMMILTQTNPFLQVL